MRRKKQEVVSPPLETRESTGPERGTLRARLEQSSFEPFEWNTSIEIFEKDWHFPQPTEWMPWEYWAREVAASLFKWRRGTWPTTFSTSTTEEGAKVMACAMLRAVREFDPVIVPEPQYLTEEDCK